MVCGMLGGRGTPLIAGASEEGRRAARMELVCIEAAHVRVGQGVSSRVERGIHGWNIVIWSGERSVARAARQVDCAAEQEQQSTDGDRGDRALRSCEEGLCQHRE